MHIYFGYYKMQTIQKQSFKSNQFPQHWKREESVYTGDHLIDAYLKGKQEGKDELVKILTNQLKSNISIATTIAERLYVDANKKKISFKSIHLKADGITKFSAVFVTKQEDFISEKFRNIFIAARKLKNEVESDSFYITFTFMPDTKNLDEKSLTADGYFLKYDKK